MGLHMNDKDVFFADPLFNSPFIKKEDDCYDKKGDFIA